MPVPNHCGAGKVSITGAHISAPHVKNMKCSNACTALWWSAA